jgi:hypothetical protein
MVALKKDFLLIEVLNPVPPSREIFTELRTCSLPDTFEALVGGGWGCVGV